MGKREQPLTIAITTAGVGRTGSRGSYTRTPSGCRPARSRTRPSCRCCSSRPRASTGAIPKGEPQQKRRGSAVATHVLGYTVTDHLSPRLKPAPSSVNRARIGYERYIVRARTKHPQGDPGDQPIHCVDGSATFVCRPSNSQFDGLDQWIRRRVRKILWEYWRKPKNPVSQAGGDGPWVERVRKATATGRRAWWNAGASHMHAAVT